jgi:membrane protein YdbS with pleckstrin-like domain
VLVISFFPDFPFTPPMAQEQDLGMADAEAVAAKVKAMERPEPALWTYYIIRAVLSGPGVLIALPYLYFRYYTLRYRFDEEGIHMKVGILFRREINLTYARIQDIHLKSGLLQRWLGLANVEVQTASGSSGAELVIEGFKEYEAIRDFLYTKMRGYQSHQGLTPGTSTTAAPGTNVAGRAEDYSSAPEAVALLLSIRDELRGTREALEGRNSPSLIPPVIPKD